VFLPAPDESIWVGVIRLVLGVPGSRSLKDKRRVLKSLKERLRNRFNVSVAETRFQDLWQRAELTVCVVADAPARADPVLESADRFVASDVRVRIIRAERSFV